ncbi:MAG: flagellar motor switch protein FliG [Burkholderiales bacterium]
MAEADGVQRSAILLVALGDQEASEVLKHLGPKDVQRLGMAIASLGTLPKEQVGAVLRDFLTEAGTRSKIGGDSAEYLRSVLTKALGPERAATLLDRILETPDSAGIESLKWLDPGQVAELIKNEHPQIIATILIHLDADQSAQVLNKFPERLRNDVLLRIATLDGVQPIALQDLNDVLTQVLNGADKIKKTKGGGVEVAAEILNFIGAATESAVTAHLREVDADLAQKIQDKMFVFDNVMDLDDRAIQTLLREIQSDSLIVALKGTSPELKEKIFKNMSQRAAEMMRDDLESKGPVKLTEVEEAQREILRTIRRLADEGQIVMGGKGEESLVQ